MSRRSIHWMTISVAAVLLVLVLTVANRAQTPAPAAPGGSAALSMIEPGAQITVFLRGDASGVAFTERSADGFLIGRQGKVLAIDDKWLVLETKAGRSFLPLNAIAVIDAAK